MPYAYTKIMIDKPDWPEILGCEYCKDYFDNRRNLQTCTNIYSPFYGSGTDPLTSEQKMAGCGEIVYTGVKIRPDYFRWIPKESILRTLQTEQVMEPVITLKEAAEEYENSLKPPRLNGS